MCIVCAPCAHADVYVRVSLLHQNKVLKTKRSDVVRHAVCSSFNESFSFRLSQSVVDVSSVSITVMQRHSSLLRG